MPKLRGLSLFASWTVLAACPAPDAGEQSTGTASSSSTDTPGTTSTGTGSATEEPTGPGPGDTGSSEPGATEPGATEPGATDTGTTGATDTGASDTGASDTGSTDTGGVQCEASWVVPQVDAELLAAHDLLWVGCEYTSCGAADRPMPGEASVLCQPDFVVADAPLSYLGHMHPNETGAFTTDDVVSPANISWLDGLRHTYRYDENVYILTEGDEVADQLDVYYTVRALETLRADYPSVYQEILGDTAEFPAEPPLKGFVWKNRLRSVVISFDTSPFYIAAGLTVLDTDPGVNMETNLQEYSNVAAISIDSETIRGASPDVGSRPIYGLPTDDENFLHYMREGLVDTLVHELLHVRVDRLNSIDQDMNDLYDRRGMPDLCASFELEEALVASASLLVFRAAGSVSDTYLDYYDAVLDNNLEILMKCKDYPIWAEQFAYPSGVHERYDLRLFDLE